jgi:hypothetical protein
MDLLPWPFFRRDAQNRGNLASAPAPRALSRAHGVGGGEGAAFLPGPNPWSLGGRFGFILRNGGPTRLTLFAVDGRLVRRLIDGSLGPGDHQVMWDGRTDRGTLASSGVYWLRLEAPGETAVRRFVILR